MAAGGADRGAASATPELVRLSAGRGGVIPARPGDVHAGVFTGSKLIRR